jgi:hypothetical protein
MVQAICPGCQGILRIPNDWVDRPIRCKHCGTVLQAKSPFSAPSQTPAPKRNGPMPPPVPRKQLSTEALAPKIPIAPPVPNSPTGVAASGFQFDPSELADGRPSRKRGKAKRGGHWIGLAVMVGLLATLGTGAAIAWPHIQKALDKSAKNGKDPSDSNEKDNKDKSKPKDKKIVSPGDGRRTLYPRRALIISIHDYLYANPIKDAGNLSEKGNMQTFKNALCEGLQIPLTQIAVLSDVAKATGKTNGKPNSQARTPIKSVILDTLDSFLETSRKQDRIFVFFIGHSRELDGKAYLVPIEGELDDAKTLIPFKDILDRLAKSRARQKILVLDANRFNPGQGLERPASGPMGAKFAEAIKNPPVGVQIWSACSAGQQSYETDDSPLGVFLDHFREALLPGKNGALEGKIQAPNDLIELDALQANVSKRIAEDLARRKLAKQEPLLAGKPPVDGAKFDKAEAQANPPVLARGPVGNPTLVNRVLDEVSVPPVRGGTDATPLNMAALPSFKADALAKYEAPTDANSKVQEAVHKARVTLWAVSNSPPPKDLAREVEVAKKELRVTISVMKDRYIAPGAGRAENIFKDRVFDDSREMARIVLKLQETLDEMNKVVEEAEKAPLRWQANFEFVRACLQAQMAYLEEYQSLLGQMRKEFPPLNKELYSGWRLASTTKMQGDSAGKKLEKQSRKTLMSLAKKHAKTPWEVLAKREMLTALGLEWQQAR